MAAKPETRFAAWVREGLKTVGCETERIENRVNLGIPDMLVGVGSGWAMVELKVVPRGKKVRVRPHQVAFMVRHGSAGRPCFFLIKHELDSVIYLYPGTAAPSLLSIGLMKTPTKAWAARGMRWDELAKELGKTLIDND